MYHHCLWEVYCRDDRLLTCSRFLVGWEQASWLFFNKNLDQVLIVCDAIHQSSRESTLRADISYPLLHPKFRKYEAMQNPLLK